MIKHSHLLSAVAAVICSSDKWLVHKPIDDDNDRNGGAAKRASVDVLQLTIGSKVGYDWPAMATALHDSSVVSVAAAAVLVYDGCCFGAHAKHPN